jgi:methylated-DNA-protein-cysteine methyltransferase-like protein
LDIKNELMKTQPYFEEVYEVVRQIPEGRVTNYGAIADFLALGSARMVGWALRNSFAEDNIPAHRVLNRIGELSGRHQFPSPTMMQELLEMEGVEVENDRVVNFKEIYWNPSEELL